MNKSANKTANKEEDIAMLLRSIDDGDQGALDKLVTLVYPDLKRLAHYQLAGERPDHTLNTTAVVHEAFVRLSGSGGGWTDHAHFLRTASKVMRHLLVDHARKHRAAKRGSGAPSVELEEQHLESMDDSMAVLELDAAIKGMRQLDPKLEGIIECRCFAGLSVNETSEALGIPVRSVERYWQQARQFLVEAINPDNT